MGGYALRTHAAPAQEVAEVVGVRPYRADETRRRRDRIQASGNGEIRAPRQLRAETLDVELAALERRLEPHLPDQALTPAQGIDPEVDDRRDTRRQAPQIGLRESPGLGPLRCPRS